jgi:YHS domain-containing protein
MALSRRSLLIGSGLVLLGGGYGAKAFLSEDYTAAWYQTDAGVAIGGYDPVGYFTEGAPVQGDAAHALDWGGTTWHFASAESKATFEADPLAYAPQYGGYCAWAVGARNALAPTEPAQWSVVDGKLYLNYSASVQEKWKEDVPGFIVKGDVNWPGLEAGLL